MRLAGRTVFTSRFNLEWKHAHNTSVPILHYHCYLRIEKRKCDSFADTLLTPNFDKIATRQRNEVSR